MTNARVFFIGGYLSYRALFNWMHWSYYIPTMLGAPVFQVLFFAYMGRFAEVENDEFFVVGNAVQLSAMAGIYGMAMTVGGERWTQTLSQLMATPANRLPLFLGRALPLIANGIITSAFAFTVGWLLLDVDIAASQIPALAVVVAVSAFSCTSLGLVVGAVGLRVRDVFFLANLVVYALVLFCGVNIPLDALPNWMETVSSRAAAHARDRGGAGDRERRLARRRRPPGLDRARDRRLLRRRRFRALQAVRVRGPEAGKLRVDLAPGDGRPSSRA